MHVGYSAGFALGLLGKDLAFHRVPKISLSTLGADQCLQRVILHPATLASGKYVWFLVFQLLLSRERGWVSSLLPQLLTYTPLFLSVPHPCLQLALESSSPQSLQKLNLVFVPRWKTNSCLVVWATRRFQSLLLIKAQSSLLFSGPAHTLFFFFLQMNT